MPYSLRILLENLLRNEDGKAVTKSDIEALAGWQAKAKPDTEIAFHPARVVLQDFTGVPAVVDLAAKRRITDGWIASKCGWTPFDGMNATGWPVMTACVLVPCIAATVWTTGGCLRAA